MLVNQIKDFLESKKIIVLGILLGLGILWAQAHHLRLICFGKKGYHS